MTENLALLLASCMSLGKLCKHFIYSSEKWNLEDYREDHMN